MTPDRPTPDRIQEYLDRPAGASTSEKVRIYVIFDTRHDADLYARLREQSQSPESHFSVMGGSERSGQTDAWRTKMRCQIREADQAIVICGEHTSESADVHAEFLAATEEKTAYFLLWGRREVMCSKPIGSTAAEGMYGWTGQVLNDQIDSNLRQSSMDAEARKLRRVSPEATKPLAPVPNQGETDTARTEARAKR